MTQTDGTCPRHEGQTTTGLCAHCRAPICRECIQECGYFCSRECLEQSRARVTMAERQQHARAEKELQRVAKVGRVMTLLVLGFALLLIAFMAWKFWLDPAGKVCWSWAHEADLFAVRLLTTDADTLVVQVGDSVATLDPGKGDVQALVGLSADMDGIERVESVEGGFLVVGGNTVARYGSNGAEVFKRSTTWERLAACLSPDCSRQYLCLTQPLTVETLRHLQEEHADLAQRKVVLSCLNLQNGEPVWSVTMHAGETIRELVATDGMLYALCSTLPDGDQGATTCLRAYVPDTGVAMWEAVLPDDPRWGPEVAGERVLVDLDGTIHAFSSEGEEVWFADIGEGYFRRRVLGDMLLVADAGSTACFDTTTGKRRWRMGVAIEVDSASRDHERLFALGFAAPEETPTEAGEPDLPKSFKDNETLLKDMGVDLAALSGKKPAPVPVLLGIDAADGHELWRVSKVLGTLCAAAGRLVMVIDTAQTSMIEMATGGEGTLVIRQYDPKDGSLLYSRQSDTGLHQPVICGDRLVGVWFERTEKPSLMSGFAMTGGSVASPKALGLIAFSLR